MTDDAKADETNAGADAKTAEGSAGGEIVTLTYMPLADDGDSTVVEGVTFPAYQPVTLTEKTAHIAGRLEKNPWFTAGAIDAERKAAWQRVRQARKTIAQATAAAEAILNNSKPKP